MLKVLRGGVKVPTGGDGATAHEPASDSRAGENPAPTVQSG